ncbi:MAG: hypothetical protein ACXWPS_07305 [Ktedonobacteraceae bacterium]
MNSIVYNPAETEPDILCMTTETTISEDIYSTTPLIAISSIYRQLDEDELHSSFEEAISDRVLALNRQFRHLSVQLTDDKSMQSSKRHLVNQQSAPTHITLLSPGFRQAMLLITIAFMLLMVGFDVMGLLILLKY